MKQKSLTVVSGILGAAVFYVIYAAICGFIPSDTSQSAILLRALAEMCAAFGGICTLMLMGKSLVPTDSEGEFADEPSVCMEEKQNKTKSIVRGAVSAVICAAILFGGNLLYSRYVYGNENAPEISLPVAIAVIGILVPISEEIFFRGCLSAYMTDRGVSRTAVIITSAASFALIHDVKVMPFAFFAGVCLGFCSVSAGKRGYIISFAAHSLYNTTLCVVKCIMQNA